MEDPKSAIVTFYSYKGGVGRSMAVANVAWLLAERYQKKVLVVDWDLEAPGLHRFFRLDEGSIKVGLIDLLYDYKNLLREETKSLPEELLDIEKYIQPVEMFRNDGSISILAAGRQDKKYATLVNEFNWEEFYSKWHGFGFIEYLKRQLKKSAEIVLVDSRTGVTDIGGICTLQLPDVVVLLFALNEQNIKGVESVIETILEKAPDVTERHGPPDLILRPSRVERYLEQDKKQEWEELAARRLGMYLPEVEREEPVRFMKRKSIPYIGGFGFGETPLAVQRDPDGELADSFQDLAGSVLEAALPWDQKKRLSRRTPLLTFAWRKIRAFSVSRPTVVLGILGLLLGFGIWAYFYKTNQVKKAMQQLNQENESLRTDAARTKNEKDVLEGQRAELKRTIDDFQTALLTTGTSSTGDIAIQIADESQRTKAEAIANQLRLKHYSVADDIENVEGTNIPPETLVKYFHYPKDKQNAEAILQILRQLGVPESSSRTSYVILNEKPQYYEIWFKKDAFMP